MPSPKQGHAYAAGEAACGGRKRDLDEEALRESTLANALRLLSRVMSSGGSDKSEFKTFSTLYKKGRSVEVSCPIRSPPRLPPPLPPPAM